MSHSITSFCTGCAACKDICPVNAIKGERKNLHSINATLCNDCGACGRICPAQAIQNAEGITCQMIKPTHWLKPAISEDQCISCGVCIEICPTGVLDFNEEPDPGVNAIARLKDPGNCIGCSFCENACPVSAISMKELVPV